ncbi:putative OSBP family protein [Lyophyllum shimeji]|uniref:OSBP family protein n=1 Tax=Lyophyllum shimeji TaxID=47721 RepID=A0A9P3PPE3_LYOSH|nr:putative OSBP family protein [Lyophyllum shimeji]
MSDHDATIPTDVVLDEDAPGPPISVPESADAGEGGKLKMIVQLVKKCLGVKDIAAMRLSLPASLMEPIPNLEYWHYLDRPDMFAAINDTEDPFERMLAVLRFTFTKDLKFVHGKVCKPYNSVLGEHFRAHWDVVPLAYSSEPSQLPIPLIYTSPPGSAKSAEPPTLLSETASVKSGRSSKSTRSGLSFKSKLGKSPSTAPTSPQPLPQTDDLDARMSSLNLADGEPPRLRVVYVTEQVSHHPPVSAYYASCPARHLELVGIDQISAKVSGTTLRVSPGEYNQGLFVNIKGGPGEGERYHITHPVASVNGILRGSFYVTVADSTIITCSGGKRGPKFRTIIEYKEESWLGKAHFLLEGVIHTVNEGDTEHNEWTKVKHVPHSRVVAVFDGSWRGHIRWRRVGLGSYPQVTSSAASSPVPSHETLPRTPISSAAASKLEFTRHDDEYMTLLDLSTLGIVPKCVRPLEKQLPHESRKLWRNVTDNLLKKEFSEATKEKVAIEQRQRDEAAERKRKGVEFVPRYFEKNLERGWAELTPEGRAAVEEELNEESAFCIEGSESAKLSP